MSQLDQHNFFTQIKGLITGGGRDPSGSARNDAGFLVDRPFSAQSATLGTGGSKTVDSDGMPVVSAAASNTALATFDFIIPRDYDEQTDQLYVEFVAYSGGGTNTPIITLQPKLKVIGAAATTPASSATAGISATPALFVLPLVGLGLKRNQLIAFILTTGAHTTDTVVLSMFKIAYRSTLVSYHGTTTDTASGTDLR